MDFSGVDGLQSVDQLEMSQAGNGVMVTYEDNSVFLENTDLADISNDDFAF